MKTNQVNILHSPYSLKSRSVIVVQSICLVSVEVIVRSFCNSAQFILCYFCSVRMLLVVLLAAVGFLLVALSTREWIAVLGVVCTSLGSGLGEVTLLSYSSIFDK